MLEKGYSGYYTFDPIKSNNSQIHYEVTCGALPKALIIAYYRKDGSISLSYKSGQNQELSKKIVDAICELAGRAHLDKGLAKSLNCTPEMFSAISTEIGNLEGIIKLSEKIEQDKTTIKFMDENNACLTVQFWNTGKIYPQSKSCKMLTVFNDAYAKRVEYSSVRDVNSEIEAMEFDENELITLDEFIYSELGYDLIDYLRQVNDRVLKTLRTAYRDRRLKKTLSSEDYSPLSQTMCRVFESIIKTIFLSAGEPEKMFTKDYFYKPSFPYILDRSVLTIMDDIDKRKRLAELYKPFRKYRNKSTHGGVKKNHSVISDYSESEKQCKEVAQAMKEFFEIVRPYFLVKNNTF